jgi:hypothetical protein
MPPWRKTASANVVNASQNIGTGFTTRKEPKVEAGKDEDT